MDILLYEVKGKKNMETNKKSKNLITCVIIVFLMIACFVGGFFTSKLLNSNKNDNNSEKAEKEKEEQKFLLDNETIKELESMREDLKKLLKENYNAYRVKCRSYISNEGDFPEVENTYVKLSINTVDTIVDKLKTAVKVEKNVVDGWEMCPPRDVDYIINSSESLDGNKKLIVMYSYEDNMLSVGYNEIGYRYYFKDASEINNFVEELS
jgi:hypothetical protein